MFISKYKRPGGFAQLLHLLESSPASSQEILLRAVAKEDPGWAHLLKVKALSIEKIARWPTSVLEIILPDLSPSALALAINSLENASTREKILAVLPSPQAQRVLVAMENKNFTDDEVASSVLVLIQHIRSLEGRRVLRFEEFAPELVIDKKLAA